VESGRIAPVVGVWTPSIVFAAAGMLLFVSAAREQSLLNLFSLRGRQIKS
jgi:hypothetical protein